MECLSGWNRTLEVLQDRVPPRPFAETERVLERELGAPVAELFAELEPQPRAAASLAQACGWLAICIFEGWVPQGCLHGISLVVWVCLLPDVLSSPFTSTRSCPFGHVASRKAAE